MINSDKNESEFAIVRSLFNGSSCTYLEYTNVYDVLATANHLKNQTINYLPIICAPSTNNYIYKYHLIYIY